MGQFLSLLSLRAPLALSFLLPWTPPPPINGTITAKDESESSAEDHVAEGSSGGNSTKEREARSVSGSAGGSVSGSASGSGMSKRKASVSAGTASPSASTSKRQHMPRRKASLLMHHQDPASNSNTDDDGPSASSSTSSASSSDSEDAPSPTKKRLAPLPPPVPRARPIPNSYWATPLLLACEYPWCPRTASASGAERPPKLDALLKAGVRCFVDLTEPGELAPYHVENSSGKTPARDGTSTPTTESSKQTASVLLQRCAVLGIPPEEVSYHRFPIQDRSLPPIISSSSSTSSTTAPSFESPCSESSTKSASHSRPSTHASSKCPLLSRALALLSANAAEGKITAVHCRGGIGRTGVVVGCFLIHSGYVSGSSERDHDSETDDEDEAGENALRLIEREWQGVAKHTRYPQSPETGPQVEYVRHYRREAPYPYSASPAGLSPSPSSLQISPPTSLALHAPAPTSPITPAALGLGSASVVVDKLHRGRATSVSVKFETATTGVGEAGQEAKMETRMITTTTKALTATTTMSTTTTHTV